MKNDSLKTVDEIRKMIATFRTGSVVKYLTVTLIAGLAIGGMVTYAQDLGACAAYDNILDEFEK